MQLKIYKLDYDQYFISSSNNEKYDKKLKYIKMFKIIEIVHESSYESKEELLEGEVTALFELVVKYGSNKVRASCLPFVTSRKAEYRWKVLIEKYNHLKPPTKKRFINLKSYKIRNKKVNVVYETKVKKCFIYILQLEDNKVYVGSTIDIEKRYKQHISGKGSVFTKKYKPLEIINTYNFECTAKELLYLEEYYTYKSILEYGIKNVSGGSFVTGSSYRRMRSKNLAMKIKYCKENLL